MTTPNTPEEHAKTLRGAFIKALNSPELLAEAKQKNMEVELISGEDLAALAKEVVVQPPKVIAQIKKLMGE